MKRKWGRRDLKKDLLFLKKALLIETDPEKINEINNAIDVITDAIDSIKIGSGGNYEEGELYFNETLGYYDRLLPVDYLESFRDTIGEFKSYDDDDFSSIVRLSRKDHIELLAEFYKSIGDREIYDAFSRVYMESAIRFNSRRMKDSDYCIYVPYLDKVYISQSFYRHFPECQEVVTGVHEVGHGIASFLNSKRNFFYGEDIFRTEIEALFFEYLSVPFYDKIFDTASFSMDTYDSLWSVNEFISTVLKTREFLNLHRNDSDYDKKLLLLNEDYDMSGALCRDVIGATVALNLIDIYNNDQERGIRLLKDIIRSSSDEEEKIIRSNIPVDSKVLVYKNHLEDRIEKFL